MVSKNNKTNGNSEELDLGQLLEKRARLDNILKKKFMKQIAVMFTDLKDSTSLAESEGDLPVRLLIKRQNDILFPIIKENEGVMVKTMGDGTLSYFKNAQNAVRAAVQIQKCIDKENNKETGSIPISTKIGLHTGLGLVESDDIFGDVVNVAARFVSLAKAGEIYISEDTHNSLSNKDEFFCLFIKTTHLKGKKEVFKIFKAFWNEKEIEEEPEQFSDPSITSSEEEERTTVFSTLNKYKLVILSDKEKSDEHLITDNGLAIGRLKTNAVTLRDKEVSRHHARIWCEQNKVFLEDLESRNGTFVDSKKIMKTQIKENQEIRIGSFRLYVKEASK